MAKKFVVPLSEKDLKQLEQGLVRALTEADQRDVIATPNGLRLLLRVVEEVWWMRQYFQELDERGALSELLKKVEYLLAQEPWTEEWEKARLDLLYIATKYRKLLTSITEIYNEAKAIHDARKQQTPPSQSPGGGLDFPTEKK